MKIIDPINAKSIYVRSGEVRSAFINQSRGEKKISINVGGEVIHLDYSRCTQDNESEFNRVSSWIEKELGGSDI